MHYCIPSFAYRLPRDGELKTHGVIKRFPFVTARRSVTRMLGRRVADEQLVTRYTLLPQKAHPSPLKLVLRLRQFIV